jgi:hypothetical protein
MTRRKTDYFTIYEFKDKFQELEAAKARLKSLEENT